MERIRISVKGVVQGVGFRPFVYRLARELGLCGSVRNTSGSVDIEVEGEGAGVAAFRRDLVEQLPPLASITDMFVEGLPAAGSTEFVILPSVVREGQFQLVSPDIATCKDCRSELFDPADRRHGYPFTNCTNCGPRFTIIEDIPYDRPLTTMRVFPMCERCRAEYGNPLDRRFHAQPNACPVCGPALTLLSPFGEPLAAEEPVLAVAAALLAGSIVALKGLGGFHLACDATRDAPVELLRKRKGRGSKPFALMMADLETVRKYCVVNDEEAEAMSSASCPIVLLSRRSGSDVPPLAAEIAPGLSRLGVMLPYTPLHHLLLARVCRPLVMTSANFSEEPIVTDNGDAVARLGRIADLLLVHNRKILTRCDDSVVSVDSAGAVPVRRARGFAPFPVRLKNLVQSVLACGAEEKNTFCLTRDREAFLSQHIGDLENAETLAHFEGTITLFRRLFRVEPEVVACDLHPEYLSTKYAHALVERTGLPLVQVQHHHAHIAACLADNDADGPVIGVALDGTGYGTDGTIWGGEFLVADAATFERFAWLEPVRMPGGSAAIRRPWRMALAHLAAFVPEAIGVAGVGALASLVPDLSRTGLAEVPAREVQIVLRQLETGLNSPLTSSAGRLFDAVSAVLGICSEIRYEAQAAILLEEAALRADIGDETFYPVGEFRVDAPTAPGEARRASPTWGGRSGMGECRVDPPTAPGEARRASPVGGGWVGGSCPGNDSLTGASPVGGGWVGGSCPGNASSLGPPPLGKIGWGDLAPAHPPLVVSLGPLWSALLGDLADGVPTPQIALRFHRSVAALVARTCKAIRERTGLCRVALSGGVFQNRLLVTLLEPMLRSGGFEVLRHQRVPCNDGGLSLGQAVIADASRR